MLSRTIPPRSIFKGLGSAFQSLLPKSEKREIDIPERNQPRHVEVTPEAIAKAQAKDESIVWMMDEVMKTQNVHSKEMKQITRERMGIKDGKKEGKEGEAEDPEDLAILQKPPENALTPKQVIDVFTRLKEKPRLNLTICEELGLPATVLKPFSMPTVYFHKEQQCLLGTSSDAPEEFKSISFATHMERLRVKLNELEKRKRLEEDARLKAYFDQQENEARQMLQEVQGGTDLQSDSFSSILPNLQSDSFSSILPSSTQGMMTSNEPSGRPARAKRPQAAAKEEGNAMPLSPEEMLKRMAEMDRAAQSNNASNTAGPAQPSGPGGGQTGAPAGRTQRRGATRQTPIF
eukprot:g45929.t1